MLLLTYKFSHQQPQERFKSFKKIVLYSKKIFFTFIQRRDQILSFII